MPLVKVEILKGKTVEYKKILLQSIQDALIAVLQIEEDDRFQRLYELEADYFSRPTDKTEQFTLIEFTLFPGRNKEIKKSIIEKITRLLSERLGIQASDVFIVMHEPPLDNWGSAGQQASERSLQYKKK